MSLAVLGQRISRIICFLAAFILFRLGFTLPADALVLPGDYTIDAFMQLESVSTDAASLKTRRQHGGAVQPALYRQQAAATAGAGGVSSCSICLNEMDRCDEFVQLTSCGHLFHAACIDRWVDAGHWTCPLCRSQLLPMTTPEDGLSW